MATPRKPKELLLRKVPGSVKRKHFACRLREDYWEWLRAECKRLNCSQGVMLELLVQAQIKDSIVKKEAVFSYNSEERRLDVCGFE